MYMCVYVQGDSCEFMLDQEDRNTTTYLAGRKRPCFSIDVYMRALHKIRAMYNVSKVDPADPSPPPQ